MHAVLTLCHRLEAIIRGKTKVVYLSVSTSELAAVDSLTKEERPSQRSQGGSGALTKEANKIWGTVKRTTRAPERGYILYCICTVYTI